MLIESTQSEREVLATYAHNIGIKNDVVDEIIKTTSNNFIWSDTVLNK